MSNSVFKQTMADMTWVEIKEHAAKNAIVLLPLGVIEEHGPHICSGTDIYLACTQSVMVRDELTKNGKNAVIAPPFYWGINTSTGSFPGSFTARAQTVKAVVFDIISSLSGWGFSYVFGINAHGGSDHNKALAEAFKEAREKTVAYCRYIVAQGSLSRYGLCGDEEYILPVEPQTLTINTSKYADKDIHAGAKETARMALYHKELVDLEKAKLLPPVVLSDDQRVRWRDGSETKTLTPDGYIGAPADFVYVDAEADYTDTARRIAGAIERHLDLTKNLQK